MSNETEPQWELKSRDDVRKYLSYKGIECRFSSENLTDPSFIQETSDRFIKEAQIRDHKTQRRHLPSGHDLFELAADTMLGPRPEMIPVRLKCARMMAGATAKSLYQLAKMGGPETAKARFAEWESGAIGSRQPTYKILKRLAKPKDLGVHIDWLHGGVLYYKPSWLVPWCQAIHEAKKISEAYGENLTRWESAEQRMELLFAMLKASQYQMLEKGVVTRLDFFCEAFDAITNCRSRWVGSFPNWLRSPDKTKTEDAI